VKNSRLPKFEAAPNFSAYTGFAGKALCAFGRNYTRTVLHENAAEGMRI
jgi:hypothetical protein